MSTTRIRLLIAPALALAVASAASAQLQRAPVRGTETGSNENVVLPPKVEKIESNSVILYYGVAFLAGAVVLGLTLMPSKRTHQD